MKKLQIVINATVCAAGRSVRTLRSGITGSAGGTEGAEGTEGTVIGQAVPLIAGQSIWRGHHTQDVRRRAVDLLFQVARPEVADGEAARA